MQTGIRRTSPVVTYFQFWQSSLLYQIGENESKMAQIESDKLTELRDPLFVISASLKIIKHQSVDEKLSPEIKRIETALGKIEKIMQC
jgi:hypothetical protein